MKSTIKNTLRMLALFGFAATPVAQAAYINVALGASVSGTGTILGAGLSTLTDGLFVKENTPWNDPSTVRWETTSPTIGIDLGANYSITLKSTRSAAKARAYR